MADQVNQGNGDQGNNNVPGWISGLPDDLKGNQTFTQFKTVGDFAKHHIETASKVTDLEGKLTSAIIRPADNATPEEWKAFYTKLGVPEAADNYELDDPKFESYTAEADKMLRQVMLNAQVSKTGAKVIHQAFVNLLKTGSEAQAKRESDRATEAQKALDTAINTLKDTWKGDEFKVNTELAHRAFLKVAESVGITDEAKQFLLETKVGNLALGDHPVMLKLFAQIGKAVSDDSINTGRGNSTGSMTDEDKARARFPKTKFKT